MTNNHTAKASNLILRTPDINDEENFLDAMNRSRALHSSWVNAPLTSEDFQNYVVRGEQPNHKSLLVLDGAGIVGVFNINEIVRGFFQSAYLGFYASIDYHGKGLMSAGLKQVLAYAFVQLELHRLEANIQPDNTRSIRLVRQNGFREEGYSPRYLKINDVWCDHIRFAMTYEDWEVIQNEAQYS
jgi:ribosomal-protein-alanine N-acetyltransferase